MGIDARSAFRHIAVIALGVKSLGNWRDNVCGAGFLRLKGNIVLRMAKLLNYRGGFTVCLE
jgi:hypothetical protein